MSSTDISDHTSAQFAFALDRLRNMALKMGGLAEERVATVVKALETRDVEAVKMVVESDYQINALEITIDGQCANILALRQPVARDLRMVLTVLKVIIDLERVGDEAQKIAKQVVEMGQAQIPLSVQQELNKLGRHVSNMLRKALDGFARTQTGVLDELKVQDRKVDRECSAVVKAFTIAVVERPADIGVLLNALWCARSLERIGDHAKNIGEYVVYLVGGKDIRHPTGGEDEAERKPQPAVEGKDIRRPAG